MKLTHKIYTDLIKHASYCNGIIFGLAWEIKDADLKNQIIHIHNKNEEDLNRIMESVNED